MKRNPFHLTMMTKEADEQHKISNAPPEDRIFKKTSPNAILTLYLGTREIISRRGVVEPLRGVLYVDPKYIVGHRLFSQLTLTFRYGREDEEVMGLKFCNEAVIALKQIWPQPEGTSTKKEELTPLQTALLERLGVGAHAFSIQIGTVAPPSVQLIPAKHYNGAPIGTSYDIRAYISDQEDEKMQKRSTVKLGIRLIHKISPEIRCCPQAPQSQAPSIPKCLRLRLSPKALKFSNKLCGSGSTKPRIDSSKDKAVAHTSTETEVFEAPQGSVDKPFMWAEGRVSLKAALNKSAYGHDEDIAVTIDVRNDSRKIVRKIRIFAVQHVDVCMFSNGKFKNVVADVSLNNQLGPGEFLHNTYFLLPMRAPTKNWIAVEGALFNTSNDTNVWSESAKIAPSSPMELRPHEDRNVFAIYVSYYVKVKLTLSGMGGEVCLKLPFVLGYVDTEPPNETPATPRQAVPKGLDSIDAVEVDAPCKSEDKADAIAVESEQKISPATNDTRLAVDAEGEAVGVKVENTVTVQIHTPSALMEADI
ncbi:arrestin homolog isoform X2 [Phlebotomus argentipes]|uniref:arrestin homolog isoform X2 n=1 Tax=Phlebotomus argentipes TaxID=94469 RepID=UPI00289337B6|nr:arrestin homolog isoform X2 [Phlebotomus argentipes]